MNKTELIDFLNFINGQVQCVIFYKDRSDVEGLPGVTLKTKNGFHFYTVTDMFFSGQAKNLFVPSSLLTGWAISMRQFPSIIFVGSWTDEEKEKGRMRIRHSVAKK